MKLISLTPPSARKLCRCSFIPSIKCQRLLTNPFSQCYGRGQSFQGVCKKKFLNFPRGPALSPACKCDCFGFLCYLGPDRRGHVLLLCPCRLSFLFSCVSILFPGCIFKRWSHEVESLCQADPSGPISVSRPVRSTDRHGEGRVHPLPKFKLERCCALSFLSSLLSSSHSLFLCLTLSLYNLHTHARTQTHAHKTRARTRMPTRACTHTQTHTCTQAHTHTHMHTYSHTLGPPQK